MQAQPRAISARYDRHGARIVVTLSNGLDLGVPVRLVQGLAGAKASDLAAVEITPTGLGLHWPKLDADLYLPSLLQGLFGTRRWTASLPVAHLPERAKNQKHGTRLDASRHFLAMDFI